MRMFTRDAGLVLDLVEYRMNRLLTTIVDCAQSGFIVRSNDTSNERSIVQMRNDHRQSVHFHGNQL
jgi:hypothetical protein